MGLTLALSHGNIIRPNNSGSRRQPVGVLLFSVLREPHSSPLLYRLSLTISPSFTIALAVSLFLLVFGISNVKGDPDLNTIWGMGIGAVDVRAMISWGIPATDLVANVLIANLAQPILSIIYFAYNSIWVCLA